MLSLLIIGAGAQARYIINTIEMLGKFDCNNPSYQIIGLIDTQNNPAIWSTQIDGVNVLGGLEMLQEYPHSTGLKIVTAISNLKIKRTITGELSKNGYEFGTVIHPSAIIANRVNILNDVVINSGVVIETGVNIDKHVIIHAGSVIEHDCQIGSYVNIGPGVTAAGRVKIQSGATIYTGAVIKPDVIVGEDSVIGAGAVVIRDVSPGSVVVGVPARNIGLVK